jgi:predicted nucleic acid-binding Zn ribbon protein
MTEEPLKVCPKCRGKLRRLIGSGTGIIFKGSGFYATDYRNSDYKKCQKEESGTPLCDKAGSSAGCASCLASQKKQKNEK